MLLRGQVFQRVLRSYAAKLLLRFPKGGTGIVATATGTDGQIKVVIFLLFAVSHNYQFSAFVHETATRSLWLKKALLKSSDVCVLFCRADD